MEIEELKALWQADTAAQASAHRVSEQDVLHMLERRASVAMRRINRSILIEVVLLVIVTGLSGWWIAGMPDAEQPVRMRWVLGAFAAAMAFYGYKYFALNRIPITERNLSRVLQRLTRLLQVYMNVYYVLIALLPLSFGFGMWQGFNMALEADGRGLGDVSAKGWLLLGGVFLAGNAVYLPFCLWYVRMLYGRHFRELKRCYRELMEQR
ncbi:MAG: hypothetical protein NW241_22910 [Bacteroidia bacterium]|nr:hypothetical protein [Bacteroidia bacterium]